MLEEVDDARAPAGGDVVVELDDWPFVDRGQAGQARAGRDGGGVLLAALGVGEEDEVGVGVDDELGDSCG